jgi:ATP-binding cassette subfamily G (WHITE) protein 2 (PDR)
VQFLHAGLSSRAPPDEERDLFQNSISTDENSCYRANSGASERGATIVWEDLSCMIPTKTGNKRILDKIEGYVKPGTLTALMGATGAGKTTLLDVLSRRTTLGIVTGNILVNGYLPDHTFNRRCGYAQQSDYHLPTATVREALRFSAEMRRHVSVPQSEKLRHADRIMIELDMYPLADAIVDTLNVEQRKRLTIGIELAAKPDLLLFLDEPTSGLDSQTAYSICRLLRRLARQGHSIMCTIHQPSAGILEMFDRILLIEQGGRTVYFGDLGPKGTKLVQYFQSRGARPCGEAENPAEWMFEVISATPQSNSNKDWHEAWLSSSNRKQLLQELPVLKQTVSRYPMNVTEGEFAISFITQFSIMLQRTMTEYWRTPSPLYAKLFFYCGAAMVIGASCYKSPSSIQGLQNLVFALFLLFTTFSNVMQKIIPQFSRRRALFEVRERPSKSFSWQAFIASSFLIEVFWQVILAMLTFVIFYYLTGFHLFTVSSDEAERGGLMLLFFVSFFLFTSSLSHVLIAGIEADETAVNMSQLLFYLMLIFCGAITTKAELPRFWIFMYRVSPLTYFLRSMFAVGVAGQTMTCSASELVKVPVAPNINCGEYLESYISGAGGRLENPSSMDVCKYCPLARTDNFLAIFNMAYSDRWKDLGIVLVFVLLNFGACFIIYWIARVPKRK